MPGRRRPGAGPVMRGRRASPELHPDPESIKGLGGIVPVIGSTEAEARRLEKELERLVSER